eukprot:12501801-Alexandrium_andersonii.AAC.1
MCSPSLSSRASCSGSSCLGPAGVRPCRFIGGAWSGASGRGPKGSWCVEAVVVHGRLVHASLCPACCVMAG